MRTAGLPNFRKLWGRLETDIPAGAAIRISIRNRYNSYRFGGKKKVGHMIPDGCMEPNWRAARQYTSFAESHELNTMWNRWCSAQHRGWAGAMTSWELHTWWWAALPSQARYCLALPCGAGHASWAMFGCYRGIAWHQDEAMQAATSTDVWASKRGVPPCVVADPSHREISCTAGFSNVQQLW